MPTTISLRLDDDLYADLSGIARARGISISALARSAFGLLVRQDDERDPLDRTGQAPVPETLTTFQRHELALLHRILARVVEGDDEDGGFEHQIERAEILERGYVGEYDDVFVSVETELSRRDSELVMDILDMFHVLEWSYGALEEADRQSLGDSVRYDMTFRGFDLNHLREARLLTYARHLIKQGKWDSLADRFDDAHERGNSHSENVAMYERMLDVFQPIWKSKVRDFASARSGSARLSVSEIKRVSDAVVHPDNRRNAAVDSVSRPSDIPNA